MTVEAGGSGSVVRERVNEIDLLRFCAALAVVFYHYAFRGHAADGLTPFAYPWLEPFAKYGYLGVHLFFMISGFVILMTAGRATLRSFVISRVVRLYPAFWACCSLTFLVTLLYGAPVFHATLSQYVVNMTMAAGFLGIRDIDGAYWSLYVEMRFYLLVAVVLLFRRMKDVESILVAWLLVSVALDVVRVGHLRTYAIADYSALFIAGATYYLIWARGVSKTRLLTVIAAWGLAVWQCVGEAARVERYYRAAFDPRVVVLLVTLFFALFGCIALRCTGAIGRRRWIVAGALTYPLYLAHQQIGFIALNAANGHANVHLLFWGTIVGIVALAYAVHAGVERKLSPPLHALLRNGLDRTRRGAIGTHALAVNSDPL